MNKKTLQSTPFGPVVILWDHTRNRNLIFRVLLSTPRLSAVDLAISLYPNTKSTSCEMVDTAAKNISRLLAGKPIDFSLEIANLSSCGTFQQRVLQAEHAIPRGSVSTYKLIADHLGVARGARAVGNSLAKNPFPLIVPCHRAIRSDCNLGGYQGGQEMKRTLLQYEDIEVNDAGKAIVSQFYYGK